MWIFANAACENVVFFLNLNIRNSFKQSFFGLDFFIVFFVIRFIHIHIALLIWRHEVTLFKSEIGLSVKNMKNDLTVNLHNYFIRCPFKMIFLSLCSM